MASSKENKTKAKDTLKAKSKQMSFWLNQNQFFPSSRIVPMYALLEYPFDTLKVRQQTCFDAVPSLKEAYRHVEFDGRGSILGTANTLYKGVPIFVAGNLGCTYILMKTFESLSSLLGINRYISVDLNKLKKGRKDIVKTKEIKSIWKYAACGAIAGGVVSIWNTPLEFFKVRIQSQNKGSGSADLSACIRECISSDQISSSLFRALRTTFLRDFIAYGLFFPVNAMTRSFFEKRLEPTFGNSVFSIFSGCFMGSIISSIFSHPFDTAKSRIQSSLLNETQNPFKALKNIYQTLGFAGLYQGFSVTMIRYVYRNTILFGGYYLSKLAMIKFEIGKERAINTIQEKMEMKFNKKALPETEDEIIEESIIGEDANVSGNKSVEINGKTNPDSEVINSEDFTYDKYQEKFHDDGFEHNQYRAFEDGNLRDDSFEENEYFPFENSNEKISSFFSKFKRKSN